jgi:hypothetical protein
LLISSAALAANDPCDHQVFDELGCGVVPDHDHDLIVGPAGPPGADGSDGQDGRDGVDGVDGANGLDGADGKDGRDGVDGIDGIDGRDADSSLYANARAEARDWHNEMKDYVAASTAIQIHLPQTKSFRMTLGTARIDGQQGVAVGFAAKLDEEVALTFGLGTSGGETVATGALSFEF